MLEAYRFPRYWWGVNGTDLFPPEFSLVDLLNQQVFSPEIGALLWALLSHRASMMVVGGYQSGSGKTTTLTALTACLPADTELVFTRGREEDFSWASKTPESSYVLVNEFSDHTSRYLWGRSAAEVFHLAQKGFSFAGTMHALSIDEVIGNIQSPPVSIPGDVLAATLPLVAMQNVYFEGDTLKRRLISLYWLYPTPVGPNGLGIKSLVAWDPRNDRWTVFSSPQTWDQLAEWANVPSTSFQNDVQHRAQYLEDLADSGITDYDDVRAALLKYA